MTRRLKSLWQGEINLCKTFWVYGIIILTLIPQLIVLLGGIIGGILFPNLPFPIFIIFVSALAFIYIIYGIFIVIAVFRSANKYQGQRIWAHLAKLMIIALVATIVILNFQGFWHELKYPRW